MSATKYITKPVEVPVKKPEFVFDPKPPEKDDFVFDPKPPVQAPEPEMLINVNLADKGPQEIKVYP